MLTDSFKQTHKRLLEDARRAEPEAGLGYDPVLNAQYFPEKGFSVVRTDAPNGYVTVAGNGSPDFEVVLKIVRQGDRSLVDGAGVVNIPGEKRPKR